jgi:predicted RNase H-like HicB family nuclease
MRAGRKSLPQVQHRGADEGTIRLRIERLPEGCYLATSPDVPGLVAEGRSMVEAVEIAQGLTRKVVESCIEHGDPLPPALLRSAKRVVELTVPVGILLNA